MRSLVSRHAEWRKQPASTKQRAFVEKRLGFNREIDRQKAERGTSDGKKKDTSALSGLTKGEAGTILTRLSHGAKARWTSEAKRQNKLWEKEESIRERKDRETVKVGKL
jgi:ATP-dependent helicase IRC3